MPEIWNQPDETCSIIAALSETTLPDDVLYYGWPHIEDCRRCQRNLSRPKQNQWLTGYQETVQEGELPPAPTQGEPLGCTLLHCYIDNVRIIGGQTDALVQRHFANHVAEGCPWCRIATRVEMDVQALRNSARSRRRFPVFRIMLIVVLFIILIAALLIYLHR